MQINKAIEILSHHLKLWTPQDPKDDIDAIQLGIEALKEVREARLMGDHLGHTLLPGETRD